MNTFKIPSRIQNLIKGQLTAPAKRKYFKKINPHDGTVICEAPLSEKNDIDTSVKAAKIAQPKWAAIAPVRRGDILYAIADAMNEQKETLASIVSLETGKSNKDALGEVGAAIAVARFFAGEGQRLYARTTTSGVQNKYAMTIREPVGIAALIISANTPIANVAWKIFPALICGNSVILKSSADAPLTSWIIGQLIQEQNIPPGAFNIIHGHGDGAGSALVEHPDINLISFTGSTAVGKYIVKTAGPRLAKISLELGGKNPFIVCDDADLPNAVKWAVLSAFSNAGQRCASGSRIIVHKKIYSQFRDMLLEKTKKLKIGPKDSDDFGPVINEKQLNSMLAMIATAKKSHIKVLTGGFRLLDDAHKNGFYLAPTIFENPKPNHALSTTELFGPITILYRVNTFSEGLKLANNSPYGLTAAIHTSSFNRAITFSRSVEAGAVVINGGTYGSEAHMPFGGVKQSGNGTREPGTEALNIYSNIKDIYQFVDPTAV